MLHGCCKGGPQRSRFPVNEEAGKLAKLSGIEPLSILYETLKLTILFVMVGRFPENVLCSKKRPLKWVRLFIEKGIEPVKLLYAMSSLVKRVK